MHKPGFTLVDTLVSLFVVSVTAVLALKALAAHATFRAHFQEQTALFDDTAFTRFQLHRLMHQSSQIGCRTLDKNLPVLNLTTIDIDAYRANQGYQLQESELKFLTFEEITSISIHKNKLIFVTPVHLMAGEHYAMADCRQLVLWTREDIHRISDVVYSPIPDELSMVHMQENTKLYKVEEVSLLLEDETLWLKSNHHKSYKLMSGVEGLDIIPKTNTQGIDVHISRSKYPVSYNIQI